MNFGEIIIGILALSLFFLLILGCLIGLPLYMVVRDRIERRRDKQQRHARVQEAIEKIEKNGRINGPKGPYVPGQHTGSMTDVSTSPPKHNGYYHIPWR